MPGRRNHARELAKHAAHQAERQHALTTMLRTQLPAHDRALVGYPAILAHLASLHVRRPNGGPLTARMLRRWTRRRGFPVVAGNSHTRQSYTPVSTTHCVTAWLLTQFANGELYRVASPQHDAAQGNDPATVYLRKATQQLAA